MQQNVKVLIIELWGFIVAIIDIIIFIKVLLYFGNGFIGYVIGIIVGGFAVSLTQAVFGHFGKMLLIYLLKPEYEQ